jgi:hypothetical protein
MKKLRQHIDYTKVIREVRTIIGQGAANIERAYKTEVDVTNWKVGRYLKETLPFDDAPSANNARIVRRLSRAFGRPEYYFYSLVKFYKLYPEIPSSGDLSWSHYEVLLKVSDESARTRYWDIALQKNMSAKVLYGLIKNDRARTGGLSGIPDLSGGETRPRLSYKRGRLYHYRVAAPQDAASNQGTATLDAGFFIFRDIPLSKGAGLHVGHMVRTVRSEASRGTRFSRGSPTPTTTGFIPTRPKSSAWWTRTRLW